MRTILTADSLPGALVTRSKEWNSKREVLNTFTMLQVYCAMNCLSFVDDAGEQAEDAWHSCEKGVDANGVSTACVLLMMMMMMMTCGSSSSLLFVVVVIVVAVVVVTVVVVISVSEFVDDVSPLLLQPPPLPQPSPLLLLLLLLTSSVACIGQVLRHSVLPGTVEWRVIVKTQEESWYNERQRL